jgi:hypothetical protein
MIYRAYRMPRLEIRPSGTTPGGIFHPHERGRGGAGEPDLHTCRSRNFRLEDPSQFFGQIFWEKILEIKSVLLASPRRACYASAVLTAPDRTAVLAPLVTIFLATHAATPPATAPSLAYILHAGWPAMPCLPANHP